MDTHSSLLHKTNSRKQSVAFYVLIRPEFKYLYVGSMHYTIWMLVPNSSLIWKQDKAKFQINSMSPQQWRNWSSLAKAHYVISCGHSLFNVYCDCITVTMYSPEMISEAKFSWVEGASCKSTCVKFWGLKTQQNWGFGKFNSCVG